MNTSDADIVLDVKNVCKNFKLYGDPVTGPAKAALKFWKRESYYKVFPAVTDISFTARRGEVIGIVGPNGAGKTTLLKMIAGLLPVDSGSITVRGKVSALLALGLGVHPEFSGRENIIYGGLLMGMSRAEIEKKIDDIVEFAEIGEFINHPFRTYSSGMRARLLFAISMSIDPDIMIIDEALATGDSYFVQKCQRKIQELCDSGATILFVSHNLYQVEELTDRCIYIRKGELQFDGPTRIAVDTYIDDIHDEASVTLATKTLQSRSAQKVNGTGDVIVEEATFSVDGEPTNQLQIGHAAKLILGIEALRDLHGCTVGIELLSHKSLTTYAFVQLFDYGADEQKLRAFDLPKGRHEIVLDFNHVFIGDGAYSATIELYSTDHDYKYSHDTTYCRYENFLSFHCTYRNKRIFGRGTMCEVPVGGVSITAIPSAKEGA